MTTSGAVKSILVTGETSNSVTVTNTSPPPDEVHFDDVPKWALTQFQTALAGGKPVEVVHDGSPGSSTGGTVASVKVSA